MRRLLVLAALVFALPAHALVEIDWVTVGDPGNACDTQSQGCFGAVPYEYQIGKYEVTNAEYAEFLNAVADTDTYALYDTSMGSGVGGITRTGSSGSYTYSAIAGREDMPVNYVSFWDALRFANWLHNGQPTGAQGNATTEDGAYTITPEGISANSITRNANATISLTSEDEWYKAAYFDGTSYFDYPAGANAQTGCVLPSGDTGNSANCSSAVGDLTDVGAYSLSGSPYGTFDQGGNVSEWNEAIITFTTDARRSIRGGGWRIDPSILAASFRGHNSPTGEFDSLGFRVASIAEPEPAPIPTLSQWGVIAFGMLLLTATAWALRRRQALEE
jgi:formylglycine-generating enzyme required for sulfatase activity